MIDDASEKKPKEDRDISGDFESAAPGKRHAAAMTASRKIGRKSGKKGRMRHKKQRGFES